MGKWSVGVRACWVSTLGYSITPSPRHLVAMRISMKTDYALRALFTLVEHYGRGPIPIRELARRNEIPKRFLEQILLDLKSQGWVNSQPGKQGGYVLAKEPERITMGQIVRHFDGILAPIG